MFKAVEEWIAEINDEADAKYRPIIEEKDRTIAAQGASLTQMGNALSQKEATLTQMGNALSQKDASIAELNAEIEKLTSQLLAAGITPIK